MKGKIPYISTTPIEDLKITFALTPLWWILGIYFIVYHFTVFLSLMKLTISRIQIRKPIAIPGLSKWLLVFLCLFVISITVNSIENDMERVLAALNNFSVYLMGFMLIIVLYNSARYEDIIAFMRIAAYLSFLGGILVLSFFILWIRGYQNLQYTALSGILLPSLKKYPYFDTLMNIVVTDTEYLFRWKLPRIPVFTSVMTSSGGQMLALIPLLIGYWNIKKKISGKNLLLLSLPFSVLILAAARTPLFAIAIALATIFLFRMRSSKRVWILLSMILIGIPVLLFTIDSVSELPELILEARGGSTQTRFELYKEAIRITLDRNPIIGIGIKVREEFTKTAIGSHSTYIALFIMTGMMGVVSFILFQFDILVKWFNNMSMFLGRHKVTWLCLGAAFLGLNLWRFTDTLDAVPYITFLYFLVAGLLITLRRCANEKEIVESGEMG